MSEHTTARSPNPLCRWSLFGLLLVAAGCSPSANEPSDQPATRPFSGQQVELAVPAGLHLAEDWQLMLIEWGEQTGAAHSLDEYEIEPGASPLRHLIGRHQAGQPTVAVLPTFCIPDLAASGTLLSPSPDQQAALGWLDLFTGLRDGVASVGRRPAVIPISCPVLVLYYRSDLLQKAGLSPPQTWAEYQQLLDSLESWAPGLSAVEPWSESFRSTMFLARAVSTAKHPGNYSLYFDIQSGRPLIGSSGFVRALEEAQQAVACMPPDVLHYSPEECRREFLAGRAALAVAFESEVQGIRIPFVPGAAADESPEDAETDTPEQPMTVGFQPLPGSANVYNHSRGEWETLTGHRANRVRLSGFGGICLGVLGDASATAAPAAWNLIETLAVRQAAAAFRGGRMTLCRRSQTNQPALWVGSELAQIARPEEYVAAVAASLQDGAVVAELPVVGHQRFRESLAEGLQAVLADKQPAKAGLQAVEERWSAIAEEIGRDAVLDSYRRSLGLPPSPK